MPCVALAADPEYTELYPRLGSLAVRANDVPSAASYLREYLRRFPDAVDAEAARRLLAKIEGR